jgi:hypothetical protein
VAVRRELTSDETFPLGEVKAEQGRQVRSLQGEEVQEAAMAEEVNDQGVPVKAPLDREKQVSYDP